MYMKDILATLAKIGIAVVALRLLGFLIILALLIWLIANLL